MKHSNLRTRGRYRYFKGWRNFKLCQ